MATLPQQIRNHKPQNARLGIKSSLSNLKRVISMLYHYMSLMKEKEESNIPRSIRMDR